MTNDQVLALMAAHLREYPDAEFRLRDNGYALTIELVHTVRVPIKSGSGRTAVERRQILEGRVIIPGMAASAGELQRLINAALRRRAELLAPKPEPREDPLPAGERDCFTCANGGRPAPHDDCYYCLRRGERTMWKPKPAA